MLLREARRIINEVVERITAIRNAIAVMEFWINSKEEYCTYCRKFAEQHSEWIRILMPYA